MRKKRAKKRILLPDPRFGSTAVTRFVNNLMLDGKKNTAFKVFYTASTVSLLMHYIDTFIIFFFICIYRNKYIRCICK